MTWTATGGNIGPRPGAMIYKNTGVAGTSTIVGYTPFGQDLTTFNGNPFWGKKIEVDFVVPLLIFLPENQKAPGKNTDHFNSLEEKK